MPTVEMFVPRELGPKDWGVELLVAETTHYIGKVMWMKAGHSGPLQFHRKKDEAFYLFSGKALLTYHDEFGVERKAELTTGAAVHIPPGAVHRVEAIEDCVMFEASTPVFEDRVPVEGVPV
jgi:mannose-6-phosphate isomerase-like protein (cupin superfamily)